MKRNKILSFIFVLTTASLFAANIDFPHRRNFRNPNKGNEFGSTKSKTAVRILKKNEKMAEFKEYTSTKRYKTSNLNYNNVELLLKDLQTKAIKNSAFVMLNIVTKE